ncbi:hypothetical protein SAMN05216388_11071, partial [Halorientalis persicus]
GSVIDSATVAVWPLPALGVLAVAAPDIASEFTPAGLPRSIVAGAADRGDWRPREPASPWRPPGTWVAESAIEDTGGGQRNGGRLASPTQPIPARDAGRCFSPAGPVTYVQQYSGTARSRRSCRSPARPPSSPSPPGQPVSSEHLDDHWRDRRRRRRRHRGRRSRHHRRQLTALHRLRPAPPRDRDHTATATATAPRAALALAEPAPAALAAAPPRAALRREALRRRPLAGVWNWPEAIPRRFA